MRIPTYLLIGSTGIAVSCFAGSAKAVVITFDNAISGQTSYSFDADGDGIPDAIFSTSDPFGFNTAGPGPNQLYIDEPGLEGTSLLNPDLRVDFLNGITGPLSFGFALNSSTTPYGSASFKLFDNSNSLLTSQTVAGARFSLLGGGTSSFPEGQIAVSFAGIGSYGLFDFDTQFGRYIIDNFAGTFGSTERPPTNVPAPLPLFGITAAFGLSRKLRNRIKNSANSVSSSYTI